SVHLRLFPELPATWRDETLAVKWNRIRDLRRVVTGALELQRADKRLGSSLQAHPQVYANGAYVEAFDGIDLAEISITSAATLRHGAPPAGAFTLPEVPDVGVVIELAAGEKCERCWRGLPDGGHDPTHPRVCGRCAHPVGERAAPEGPPRGCFASASPSPPPPSGPARARKSGSPPSSSIHPA